MTSKERMLIAMQNKQADMVPVTPDISNMIPCRLTGRPFWDIYLYQNPPLWKAYIDAVKYFGFDGFLEDIGVLFPDEVDSEGEKWEIAIVKKTDEKIITHMVLRG